MPDPVPKYQPKLRANEVEKAREVLRRRSSPHGQATRARLAVLLYENRAIENREAARLLGVHENTIRRWRKRWVEEGFSLEDKPRPGRPRSFSPSARYDD